MALPTFQRLWHIIFLHRYETNVQMTLTTPYTGLLTGKGTNLMITWQRVNLLRELIWLSPFFHFWRKERAVIP